MVSVSNEVQSVPLMLAAAQLEMSRERALRRLLDGELDGRVDERGRWWVTAESLERYRERRGW